MAICKRVLRLYFEKHLISRLCSANSPIAVRTIMTSPTACEKAVEVLKANPYFDKYSKKISQLQQTSPEEFLARFDEAQMKSAANSDTTAFTQTSASAVAPSPAAKARLESTLRQARPKLLSDVMKVDLLTDKNALEINQIWMEYHKHKGGLAATIPADIYQTIMQRSCKFPMFLFPLPRNNGYEFIVCQFSGHEVHFTTLINYQTHKENAPECLQMTHYVDLIDSKEIVLMRGEFNLDILDAKEAQCLANQLQLYYATPDDKRLRLLEKFTLTPAEFSHMEVVAQLECFTM